MSKKHTTYRIPEDFNPHTCMDTIRGLTSPTPSTITSPKVPALKGTPNAAPAPA